MTLGESLKSFRKRRLLTQKDLANKIGVSVPTISQYECDKIDIPYSKLKLIEEALNCRCVMGVFLDPNSAESAYEIMDAITYGEEKKEIESLIVAHGLNEKILDEMDKNNTEINLLIESWVQASEETKSKVSEFLIGTPLYYYHLGKRSKQNGSK